MSDSEPSPISAETIDMIEGQVKKGKARKFFLIYKGSSIKCLVVFKKGAFGSKVLQAKKDGFKGEVCYGVLTGAGKNLYFQLPGNAAVAEAMKVDTWEDSPPMKPAKLRMFLSDSGLDFKVAFCVIKSVADAPNPDLESDLPAPPPPVDSIIADQEEQDSQTSQPEAPGSPVPPSSGESTDQARELFKQRVALLLPRAKQAAGTPVGEQAMAKLTEATKWAKQNDFVAAMQSLEECETILSQEAQKSDVGDNPNRRENLIKVVVKLGPLIQQAIVAHPNRKAELADSVKQIKGLLQGDSLDEAQKLIVQLHSTLKGLMAVETESKADVVSIWRSAKDSVDSQLERFRAALVKTGDAYLSKVATGGMETLIYGAAKEYVSMHVALMELEASQGDARKSKAQKLLETIEGYQAFVAKNRFISVCDANKLCGPLTVGRTLEDALDKLHKAAGSMAA